MQTQTQEFPKPDKLIDLKGFLCPIPAIRTARFLSDMPDGFVLAIETTDPKTKKDFPLLCDERGYEYAGCMTHENNAEEIFIHIIKK